MKTLLAAAALALLACNAGFDPQYRVTDLRILAVKAQAGTAWADIAPGDLVDLDAVVLNPLGRAPLSVGWYACAPPLDGKLPPCLDPEFQRDPAGLVSDPRFAGRVTLVGFGQSLLAVPLTDLVPGIDAALLTATNLVNKNPATYACLLYTEISLVVVAEAGGRREVAQKTVRVVPQSPTGAYVRNLNPAIDDVVSSPSDASACAGGTSVGTIPLPAGTTVICGRPSWDAAQSVCGPGGDQTNKTLETLSWQWYVTPAGTFPQFGGRGDATGESVDFERPAVAFTLWGILRDGRGGVTWTWRDLAALP